METKDLKAVRSVQNKLLMAYENDLSKHAPAEIVTKLRMLWNSIPTQLTRENKKFIYGLVREGARAREIKYAVRTSMSDYRNQNWMVNYPLYSVGSLNKYLVEEE